MIHCNSDLAPSDPARIDNRLYAAWGAYHDALRTCWAEHPATGHDDCPLVSDRILEYNRLYREFDQLFAR